MLRCGNLNCSCVQFDLVSALNIAAIELAVRTLNEVLEQEDPALTLKVLKESGGNFPFMYQNADMYHSALIKEKKNGLPGNILVEQEHVSHL